MPDSYDPAKPTALVIVLHGFAGNASGLRRIAVWEPVAARENFLVVYPEGSSFPLRWNIGPVANIPTVDDVKFIRDLIMEMRATTSADPSRIYVAGFSNGGQMTHRLACQLADQIAAVGIVDGFDGGMLEECAPSRSIPVMAFFGTADPLAEVIYPAWFRALMNVAPDPAPPLPENAIDLWAFGWAKRNGCATAPIRLPSTSNAAAILFDQCQNDAQVFLYRVEGQGHAWPGGPSLPLLGESVSDINASEALWAFFQEHPLPKLP